MLSETGYILFLASLHSQNRSMSSLNGLRAYRKWLHRQGCTDWDDWETLVDIVVGKSELWGLAVPFRRWLGCS